MEKNFLKYFLGFILIVFLFGSVFYVAYRSIHKVMIDPFDNVDVSFMGSDGVGYSIIKTKETDNYSPEINNFCNSIKYVSDKETDLRNGDIITVSVDYNEDALKDLNIEFTDVSKEFTVSNLQSFKDKYDTFLSKDVSKQLLFSTRNKALNYAKSNNIEYYLIDCVEDSDGIWKYMLHIYNSEDEYNQVNDELMAGLVK